MGDAEGRTDGDTLPVLPFGEVLVPAWGETGAVAGECAGEVWGAVVARGAAVVWGIVDVVAGAVTAGLWVAMGARP